MRERLKDSTIPTFSDVSGELSKTPAAEAEKAVNLRFKESLRDPVTFKCFVFFYLITFYKPKTISSGENN